MNIKKTIHRLFEKHAQSFPEHIAIRYEEQWLTYSELNKKANQLAHYLQKIGVKPDTPIAICLGRSIEFLIAIMAVLKAGGAYLPLDDSQPAERLLLLLNDSQAPILITQTVLKEKFSSYSKTVLLMDKEKKQINQEATNNLNLPLSEEQLAYIIYTSGSTGTPKGVLIEHRSVLNYCQWFKEYSGCHVQQRIDFSSNPIFDMSVSVSLVPLMLGLTIVMCDDKVKKNTGRYLHYLADAHVNIIKLTPSYFKVLLQEIKNKFIALPHLKAIVLGGENLAANECKAWLALYPKHILFNEYGPTETTVAVSAYPVSNTNIAELDVNIPIGQIGSQMNCHIFDQNTAPVPEGEAGELFIGGICLARGYLNKPELTQKQFIQDPFDPKKRARLYKTGDLCRKRPDGVIEYLGRIDDQVKIRGFRIEPTEIEKVLASHPAIKTVAIVAQKDALNEYRLVAYYILKSSNTVLTNAQIREFLQNHLPDYMIPTVFVKVASLPLTANGKLDKSALPAPKLEVSQNYVAPKTTLEKKITQIWSEELGIEVIGLQDNFFELGGHSLSAARLVSKINHALAKNITLYDFYQAANIKKLALILKRAKKIKKPLHPYRKKEYQKSTHSPLSDFQFLLWMSNTFEPRAKKLNIVARKRVQGRLNKTALEFAFQTILKKHQVLIYKILKFQPIQKIRNNNKGFQLIEKNMESLSIEHSETKLETSMAQLINFDSWPKNAPLIIARLFYLPEDATELQICMPHLISDDASVEILFADLSKFYLLYINQLNVEEVETDTQYRKYVLSERYFLENSLDKNILFWEEYLKDTSLFAFPKKYIIENMQTAKLPYSTYTQIPRRTVNDLKSFCEQNHISVNNGLSAVVALALRNCCGSYQNDKSTQILINAVKSTRDNPMYDGSIGCFLRIEPIRVSLNAAVTLPELAQQVLQSTIDTSNYQQCSNLIKLSSASTFNQKRKILSYLIDILTPIYTKILQIPSVYRKILQHCGGKLVSFKRNNHFLINLNVRNSFIADSYQEPNLFGLKSKQINNQQDDLLAINNIFDACFFYDDNQKVHYLVISANLAPQFREMIAEEVINLINSSLKTSQKLNDECPCL